MERRPVHLPGEIVEEILLRVAVKSLLRFRCVSKSYCSLIDSKRFIKTHHQKSSRDSSLTHHRVLLFSYSHTDEASAVSGCSLLSFFDEPENNASKLNLPASHPPLYYKTMSFVGCCNGLVCIHIGNDTSQFILWNPSTRVFKILPHIDKNINIVWSNEYQHAGFGWDESSDDYKVIAFYSVRNKTIRKLYNLKTDSWKEIQACDIDNIGIEAGVLARGKLYMMHYVGIGPYKRENIVAFDLKREVFENVKQPRCSIGCSWIDLGTFGGSFSLHCRYRGYREIWAMKEESWVKVMRFCDDYVVKTWTSPCVQAFYKGAKGEIVLMNMNYFGKHLAYDLKNKCFHRRGPYNENSDIYVESLVSPLV